MIEAVSVGSFLIPTRPVSLIGALIVAIVVSGFVAGRAGLNGKWISGVVETSALVGLVGARLVFAASNWNVYKESAWTVLYLWQPGYNLWAGLLLAMGFTLWRLGRQAPEQRRAYLRVLGMGYGIGLSVLLGLFLILFLAQRPGILRPGDTIPDFSMESISGKPVRFSSLAGRAVVLNFWATWCPPCRREMPLLEAVNREYKDRGLVIVGINLSEPRERVRSYVKQVAVTYPVWLDASRQSPDTISSRELFQRFGGVGLPTTIFIDRTGRFRDIYVGELNRAKLQLSADELTARIEVQ